MMQIALLSSNRAVRLAALASLILLSYLYMGSLQPITTAYHHILPASFDRPQANVIDLYLRTLAKSLSGYAIQTDSIKPGTTATERPFDERARRFGKDWPKFGFTMIGMHRLDQLRNALEEVMGVNQNNSFAAAVVDGDYLECGVWRGGASIFATGVLSAWSDTSREVHLCDSFQGLPQASTSSDTDYWSKMHYLEVSLDTVRHHFERFDLLQDRVKFHRGYFQFSLPIVREEFIRRQRKFSVLRLDGDMYESTMDELFNLYDLVSVGGIIIIDDWAAIEACRIAVVEFMEMHGIVQNMVLDGDVAFWRKEADVNINYDWYLNWNLTRKSV